MWLGKVAIIMFIFNFCVLYGMYFGNQIWNNPNISSNWNEQLVNQTSVKLGSLTNLNNGKSPDPELVFGDFLIGVTVAFNVLASVASAFVGGGLASMLLGIPGFNISMSYIVQIIYGASSALLWVYIVSFRSL